MIPRFNACYNENVQCSRQGPREHYLTLDIPQHSRTGIRVPRPCAHRRWRARRPSGGAGIADDLRDKVFGVVRGWPDFMAAISNSKKRGAAGCARLQAPDINAGDEPLPMVAKGKVFP